MSAFAMILPPQLSEEPLKCLQRYGAEHCEEFRLVDRPDTTIFAAVLRHPFASKKSAQTAFGLNLKAWGIKRQNRATRGWYRELTVAEYLSEFKSDPAYPGRRMRSLVSDVMAHANRVALRHIAKAIEEQDRREMEELQRERDAMKTADFESREVHRRDKDPEKFDEKMRVHRERSEMMMEDRWAQRIRYAETLPPPRKRARYITDLPRPPKYI